jgi:hypothetical protein
MFPFAVLPSGDYLVFDYAGSPKGRVGLWLHERSTKGQPFLEAVADNFTAFAASLRVTSS